MNISDQDIMEKMQQNPNVGMKLLMDAYQERLYWHIRRLVVSHDDAQDLLQETFLKVYRSWDSFKGQKFLVLLAISHCHQRGVEQSALQASGRYPTGRSEGDGCR